MIPKPLDIFNDKNNVIISAPKVGTSTLRYIKGINSGSYLDLEPGKKQKWMLIRHPYERYVSGLISNRTYSVSRLMLGPQEKEKFSNLELHNHLVSMPILRDPSFWDHYIKFQVNHNNSNNWGLRDVHTSNWLDRFVVPENCKIVHLKQMNTLLTQLGYSQVETRNESDPKVLAAVEEALEYPNYRMDLFRYLRPEIKVYERLVEQLEFATEYPEDKTGGMLGKGLSY
jgi:hypothetical protein